MTALSAATACTGKKTKTYFVQGALTGLVKIGKTQTMGRRFLAIQSVSPDIVCLLKVVSEDREAEYHKRFAHLRQHGEWFTPAPELLDFINEL